MTGTTLTTDTNTDTLDGGFEALGKRGDHCFIWSNRCQCVLELGPADVTSRASQLMVAIGDRWAVENYPRINARTAAIEGADWKAVGRAIADACHARGYYDPAFVRGSGVWQAHDDLDVLVLNGSTLERTDGRPLDRTSGGFTYEQSAGLGFTLDTPAATPEDIAQIQEVVGTFRFKRPSDRAAILGWLVTAVLAGTLPQRPHLLLTGPTGCGKSTLRDFMNGLLEPDRGVLASDGAATTAAGVRQSLKRSALAVSLDQAEAEGKRLPQLIELIRSAYSDKDGVRHGSASGEGVTYSVRFSALLAAVRAPAMLPEDLNRLWPVDLLPITGAQRPHRMLSDIGHGDVLQLGRRFRRLVVARWPVMRETIGVMADAMLDLGYTGRTVTTAGTILSGWWAITKGAVITRDEAARLLAKVDFSAIASAVEIKEDLDAFGTLLDSTIQINGFPITVATAVARVLELGFDSDIDKGMQRFGIRVLPAKAGRNGSAALAVATSGSHPGLCQLYANTRWANGGWSSILARAEINVGTDDDPKVLPATKTKIAIEHRVRDAVLVPIPGDLLAAANPKQARKPATPPRADSDFDLGGAA